MDATAPFTFSTTPTIVFGSGRISLIGALGAARLGRRALIVTDGGIVRAGLLDGARASLDEAGIACAVFDGVVADPPESVIHDALALARDHGADCVIGFGGGSSLDAAKLVALLARSGETLSEIYGVGLAKGPRLPLLLAPTTAGTGSEVTPIAIVTTGTHEKKGVVAPILLPDIALLDPALTLGLPPAVTAATGVDAMVHAIEAYTSVNPNANPVSKALAREALRLMAGAIRRAVATGGDLSARSDMLLGSMLAGQAFANSPVAAVHALAYPLGGHFGIPHGLSNALVLASVMRFNLTACAPAYAELAPILFPGSTEDRGGEGAQTLPGRIAGLCAELGLPERLRDAGVPREALPLLADDAMKQTRLLVNNPRPLAREDALAIYEGAW